MNKIFHKLFDWINPLPLKVRANQTASDVVIDIQNLEVTFKTSSGMLHAIRGIDLQVRKGEIIGIVGESGSGKSVTVKTLLGSNQGSKVTATKLNLLEFNLLQFNERHWKYLRGSQIGYIPQDPLTSLNPVYRIGDQLREAYLLGNKRAFETKMTKLRTNYWNAKLNGVSTSELQTHLQAIKETKAKYLQCKNKKIMEEKIIEILHFIGIKNPKTAIHAFPNQYSGGMRQRIVIAQVILAQPRVIIADEPTTALDVIVQAKVLDLLKKINEKYRITIVLISHNIGLVANFCDYMYIIYAGRIVEKGPVYSLFTNPRHPYTWALILSILDSNSKVELASIPGTPPSLLLPPLGDAFAPRNKWALQIDFEQAPPMFRISANHYAATWLLDRKSPMKKIPDQVLAKLSSIKQVVKNKQTLVNQKRAKWNEAQG